MLSVLWYTTGVIDEGVVEKEVRERIERKDRKQAEGGKKSFRPGFGNEGLSSLHCLRYDKRISSWVDNTCTI
jgi:hypothetical protein